MTNTIIDLGKIKFKWKGDYNALTDYKADDVVSTNNRHGSAGR